VPVDKTIKAEGLARPGRRSEGREVRPRAEVNEPGHAQSGDLVEIELVIESKNDYEYLMFEDMKAAGFEPVELRSGYGSGSKGLRAYVEYRDNRVVFFVRWLPRGRHSLNYRMRAEIPGRFSALPTQAHDAPEPCTPRR
jgi:alpha-2-macroglobulin